MSGVRVYERVPRTPRQVPDHLPYEYPREQQHSLPFTTVMASAVGSSALASVVQRPVEFATHFNFMLFGLSTVPRRILKTQFWDKWAEVKHLWFKHPISHPEFVATQSAVLLTFATLEPQCAQLVGPNQKFLTGACAGSVGGLCASLITHPLNVLRATAAAPGPKVFTGPFDVFRTALANKPQMLLGLPKGYLRTATPHVIRYGCAFGMYNAFRETATFESEKTFWFMVYCSALFGHIMQYPAIMLPQELDALNASRARGGRIGYRYLFAKIYREHGTWGVMHKVSSSHPITHCFGLFLTMCVNDAFLRWSTGDDFFTKKRGGCGLPLSF